MSVVSAQDGLLLERDRELERVRRRLQQAAEGRGGALVIEGPAGIGKTALLAAACEDAQTDGFQVLRARGAELEREFAFGVVRQLVEPLLANASKAERGSLLEGPAQLAAHVLGLPGATDVAGGPVPVAPDPSFAVLHGLYWLCAHLADQHPLALVVDDTQWADGASLRFLAFLLPRFQELRVAVLLAARPAEAGTAAEVLSVVTLDPATERVPLGPLTADGVASLIAAGLRVEPEPAFVAACREATGGAPFLVRTLVSALAEEGIAPVGAAAARVRGLASATVGRWGLLQLRRMGTDAASLARAVAVLERADLVEAAMLAGLGTTEAARAAGLLARAGILEEQPLAFAHPLLRAGVYREMSAADRGEAHGRAARLLAEGRARAARVAEHLLATEPGGDGWVVEQLRGTARAALARGAPESAAAYLRRAIVEPPPPEARATVLLDLGRAELNAGQPGWEDHLRAALAAAGEDASRVAAALLLATALGFQMRTGEAVEVCDRAIARVEGGNAESRWLLESMAILWGTLEVGTAPTVVERARSLIVFAREQPVARWVAEVAAFQAAMANEPADSVVELAHRAIVGGRPARPEPGDETLFLYAAAALVWAGRYAEVQALLDAAVAEARATVNGLMLPPMLQQRSRLAFHRGDLVAAEADARAVLDSGVLAPPRTWRVLATVELVATLVERGELEEAEHALETVASDLQATYRQSALLRHGRGRLRFEQRRYVEAVADFLAAGDIATRTGALSPCYLPWRSEAALAQLTIGEVESARRLTAEELELARAFGAPRALGVALRAAGLVAGGPGGEELLREAVEELARADARLEHARALADLGALLRRSNRRSEAREPLRQAIDVAHRVGARRLASQAETELRATGAKPRRLFLTGLEALTASERRIAELAAQGLTNRQIAQHLFVTAGTVEGHLTSVFTKLDVRTRTELPRALEVPAGGL